MREALREAQSALLEGEVPIGAVVVCAGRIIGRGHNMVERLHDPTAHAEMIALTAATEALGGKYLENCTLFVTVEPCPMCAAALSWAQTNEIVWGADDPKRGFSLYKAEASMSSEVPRGLLHPKTKTRSGILSEECNAIMRDFFKTKR